MKERFAANLEFILTLGQGRFGRKIQVKCSVWVFICTAWLCLSGGTCATIDGVQIPAKWHTKLDWIYPGVHWSIQERWQQESAVREPGSWITSTASWKVGRSIRSSHDGLGSWLYFLRWGGVLDHGNGTSEFVTKIYAGLLCYILLHSELRLWYAHESLALGVLKWCWWQSVRADQLHGITDAFCSHRSTYSHHIGKYLNMPTSSNRWFGKGSITVTYLRINAYYSYSISTKIHYLSDPLWRATCEQGGSINKVPYLCETTRCITLPTVRYLIRCVMDHAVLITRTCSVESQYLLLSKVP